MRSAPARSAARLTIRLSTTRRHRSTTSSRASIAHSRRVHFACRSRAAPAICDRRSRRSRFPSIRSCLSSRARVCRANKSASRIPGPSSSTTVSRLAGCAAEISWRWRRTTSAPASCSIRLINGRTRRIHRVSSGPSSVSAVTWRAIRWACPDS